VRETLNKLWCYWSAYRPLKIFVDRLLNAPERWSYTDLAIEPQANETDTLELYHATRGGEEVLARKRHNEAVRARMHAVLQESVRGAGAAQRSNDLSVPVENEVVRC
jgi:hypothetical protein